MAGDAFDNGSDFGVAAVKRVTGSRLSQHRDLVGAVRDRCLAASPGGWCSGWYDDGYNDLLWLHSVGGDLGRRVTDVRQVTVVS